MKRLNFNKKHLLAITSSLITDRKNPNCIQNWADIINELGLNEVASVAEEHGFTPGVPYYGETSVSMEIHENNNNFHVIFNLGYDEQNQAYRFKFIRWRGGSGNDLTMAEFSTSEEAISFIKAMSSWKKLLVDK